MRKTVTIWLVIATALVVIGLVMFAAVMTANGWDFTALSTVKYETNTYEIEEEFHHISMKTDTADIVFVPSEDENCKVVCYEEDHSKHSAAVVDGTLTVEVFHKKEWYHYIGISFRTPKLTVYLPKAEYGNLFVKEDTGDIEIPKDFQFESVDITASTGDVKCHASASGDIQIKTSTGYIEVENISARTLSLSVSTGNVTATGVRCEGDVTVGVSTGKSCLTDVSCKNLTSSGNTGDIFLKNVIAAERISIERSTGDVKFDGCDASEISVVTDTGDVTGTLLSDKVFITKTDTGDVDVPTSVSGGRCEITTDTGDIQISIR